MALIDDIIAKIEALPISGGDLALTSSDFMGIPFMEAFFSNVLRTTGITLTGAERLSQPTSITVTGTAGLLGYTSLSLSITFVLEDNQVVGTVTGTFDPSKTTSLPVLAWIKVGDVTLTASMTEIFSIVSFGFGMNVITSRGARIPVSLSQLPGGDWRLAIADGATQGVTATEIVDLLDGEALLSFLPPGLATVLDALDLNGIEAVYNTDSKTVSRFTATVRFDKGWDIAPKISLLPGLQINLTLLSPTDAARRECIANVMGTLMIGEVAVPLQVGTSVGGTVVWSFGIQVGQKVTLPSLSSLLDLADASSALPDGLSKLPAIDIDEFAISFDSTKNVLTELDFSVATASKWPVIKDYFEIEQLSIAFQMSDVNVAASRQVFGNLYGLFMIGDTVIFCSLAKTVQNPDWTITAGLPPDAKFGISTLFAQMLKSFNLPSDLPTIDFTTLLITVVPEKGTFTFSAGSTDSWELTDKLSIPWFQLDFEREPDATIKGSIAASLKIGSVTIDLSASLNETPSSGWEFSGKTKEGDAVQIGDFLTYIANTFDVGDPPAWMKSIKLKDISATLNTATKNFSFGITADATISGKSCELTVEFALTHSGVKPGLSSSGSDTYKLALSGTVKIDTQIFTLDFTKTGTDTLLGASWVSGTATSLSLQDIASIFGDAELTSLMGDIPSDMDLALTSLSFTYDFTQPEFVLTAVSKNYGAMVFVAAKSGNSWIYVLLAAIGKFDLTKLPIIGEEVGALGSFEIDDFHLLVCSGSISKTDIDSLNKLIAAAGKTTKATLPSLPEGASGLQKGVNLSMTFQVAGYSAPVMVGTATPAPKSESLLRAKRPVRRFPVHQEISGIDAQAHGTSDLAVVTSPTASTGDDGSLQAQNKHWINLQKAFGPVYMDKIGFAYARGVLDVSFNFSLKLGAMTLSLDGLSAGSPLTKFDPSFELQGLGLSFSTGPVVISGGFIKQRLKNPDGGEDIVEYNGQAMIKAGPYALSALGSYAKVEGETSMFIFAMVMAPFGGPPYFFITGLAAGFGYNRSLTLPAIDQVTTFPLVSSFVPGQGSPFGNSDPNAALQVLVSRNVVPIAIGENWLAAGIQFTSFQMLQSFALVSVEFGSSLEIALLGITTASIPTGDPRPLLFAQLALEVRVLPQEGLIAVEAQLTSNSYLLDSSCHLTGGFAFYVWFGNNPHAGDFVVTLGGYHPAFKKPDHYPDVPRLGFNWVVTSELTIKGGMYFALTPLCLMAGGNLQALWQSGSLKCWFNLGADFIIMWKPYHYELNAYLSFGVSYTFRINLLFTQVTETISVSLGANLGIWGPAFSGVAHIHLWIVSFTVSFGASTSQAPPSLSWSEFEQSFLPPAHPSNTQVQKARLAKRMEKKDALRIDNPSFRSEALEATERAPLLAEPHPPAINTDFHVWNLAVPEGLLQNVAQGPSNPEGFDWIVCPDGTELQAKTVIPAKTYKLVIKGSDGKLVLPEKIYITNAKALEEINLTFGVGPSAVETADFHSEMDLTLTYQDGLIDQDQDFHVTALIDTAPKALWIPGKPDIGADSTLVSNVLVGFQIIAMGKEPEVTPFAEIAQLGFRDFACQSKIAWSTPAWVDGPDQPSAPIELLKKSIVSPSSRQDILDSLIASGTNINPAVDVSRMGQFAGSLLSAPPVFAYEYAG